MSLKEQRQHFSRQSQNGYVLLTLLLVVAMMVIFTAAIVPSITVEIKRDREEEMIHRGVQYSRAIRLFYQKFGRYPTKLEDLESTNNMRFLRKRYKDPVTRHDFNLLHYGDTQQSIGGAGVPGSPLIGHRGVSDANGTQAAVSNGDGLGTASSFAGTNSFGVNSETGDHPAVDQLTDSGSPQPSSTEAQLSGPVSQNSGTDSGGRPIQIVGGSIVGVVSSSKAAGFREFDHKNKYNEWLFVFDPMIWMGLPTAPNQHPLQLSTQPLDANSAVGPNGRISSSGPQNDSNVSSAAGISISNQSGESTSESSNPH